VECWAGRELVLPDAAAITVPAQTLGVNDLVPYRFTLTVRSGEHTPQATYIDVFVVSGAVPETAIATRDGTNAASCMKVNSNDALLLNGVCSGGSQWSLVPQLDSGLVSDMALFPFLFSSSRFMISQGANQLVRGVHYAVSLTCTSAGSPMPGRASLDVCANAPPSGGTCQTCLIGAAGCQKTGVALLDRFLTRCVQWADSPDVPLRYRSVAPAPCYASTRLLPSLRPCRRAWSALTPVGRLGYQIGGTQVWDEWQHSPVWRNRFPSGTVTISIFVADSLGT